VVIVSHDRHMLELTADRLVLVDAGTAREFEGSLDDYIAFILGGDRSAAGQPKGKAKGNGKDARRAAAEAREKGQTLRKRAGQAEKELARLTEQRSALDRAMFDPASAAPEFAKLTMGDLMRRRAELESRIAAAEGEWMAASEALETIAA
jgi:ATP-binding cassette subfamily F protein 3